MKYSKYILSAAIAMAMVPAVNAEPVQGFYFSGQAGASLNNDSKFDTGSGGVGVVKSEYNTGFTTDGAIGYTFGQFRTEAELGYRSSVIDNHKVGGVALPNPEGKLNTLSGMLNGYVDIPTSTAFTPYLGVGLGIADVKADNYRAAGLNVLDDSQTVFAYQGMAGVSYAATKNIDLFTEYKYFGTSRASVRTTLGSNDTSINDSSNNFSAGLRYHFN